jgi:hypothetical protein
MNPNLIKLTWEAKGLNSIPLNTTSNLLIHIVLMFEMLLCIPGQEAACIYTINEQFLNYLVCIDYYYQCILYVI